MDGDILVSTDVMMRAFARWDTLFRKDPNGFKSDIERILRGETPEEYGKACADYFRGLIVEVR